MTNNKEKAVGYIRVSSQDQVKNGLSLESQVNRIKAYCELKNLELVEIYSDEAISGGKIFFKRPAGNQLHDQLKKGQIKHLIGVKLDRLFRNTLDAIATSTELEKMGIGLHLLDMNIDTTTAAGKLFYTMVAAFAQMEREQTSERVKSLWEDRRSRGLTTVAPRYGFENSNGKIIKNAREQEIIERILDLRNSGRSFELIADILNKEGVPTKKGSKWFAMSVKRAIHRTNP